MVFNPAVPACGWYDPAAVCDIRPVKLPGLLSVAEPVTGQPAQPGVPRRARSAHLEGTGADLSDRQPGSVAGDVRVKALYRSWAIPSSGKQVYAMRQRALWLDKIAESGVRRRAEFY
jgi:hypothetical protein